MKAVVQRVSSASVTVGGKRVSEIGEGLLVLLGVEVGDVAASADWMARKIAAMRIFNDSEGVMNRSVMDIGGDVMVVSQFTLCASVKKGNRPSYVGAAGHDVAIPLYEYFCGRMEQELGDPERVKRGIFGADMKVALVNDGPVTIMMEHPC